MTSTTTPGSALMRVRFLEAVLESATDYAIIAMDLDGLVKIWNEGARRIMGWTEDEIVGKPASIFFTLEDRQKGVHQAEMRAALTRGRGSDERWHQRKDGSCFWASGEMMPLKDELGTVMGFIKILRDRTEQRAAMERQRTDAEFLRSVLASSDDCIKVLDLDGKLTFMSEGGQRVMEVSNFDAIRGRSWPDFWPGDGCTEARNAIAAARAGGSAHFQALAKTLAGNSKWWDVQVTPIRGSDGQPEKLLCVLRDISELKQGEERQQMLMQELAHRVKNTLSIVQAICSQTFRGNDALLEVRDAFSARIIALSKAHDVLMRGSWVDASLRALVDDMARLHGMKDSPRFRIDGSDVTIGPKAALAFALVLHELATNASKYGALANDKGYIDITWRESLQESVPQLNFCWLECDGPPVATPPQQGFGSRLIERSLQIGPGAQSQLSFLPGGVKFTLDTPLSVVKQT
jgi:PAS domain S-box-containing protein